MGQKYDFLTKNFILQKWTFLTVFNKISFDFPEHGTNFQNDRHKNPDTGVQRLQQSKIHRKKS
jgi:hypothetical protein